MTAIIIINVSVMSLNYYGIETDGGLILIVYTELMKLCTRIYYVECLLKLLGLTITGELVGVGEGCKGRKGRGRAGRSVKERKG